MLIYQIKQQTTEETCAEQKMFGDSEFGKLLFENWEHWNLRNSMFRIVDFEVSRLCKFELEILKSWEVFRFKHFSNFQSLKIKIEKQNTNTRSIENQKLSE